jgi:hypothetical protein
MPGRGQECLAEPNVLRRLDLYASRLSLLSRCGPDFLSRHGQGSVTLDTGLCDIHHESKLGYCRVE